MKKEAQVVELGLKQTVCLDVKINYQKEKNKKPEEPKDAKSGNCGPEGRKQ